MNTVACVGLDIAKDVFQVHGVDKDGDTVLRRRLRRGELLDFFKSLPPCVVGMEACGGAHHWARTLARLGHSAKLVSSTFVKPFVKSQKNDAADAEAICEAVSRPHMRFVAIKTEDEQAVLAVHRVRDTLVRQRTALINALRSHIGEFGHVENVGKLGIDALLSLVESRKATFIPKDARPALRLLAAEIRHVRTTVHTLERQIHAWHRANPQSRRLATIPGVGVLTASALAASISDARMFRTARGLSAWLGLVPRQFSTGGHIRLGGITKRGDRNLRRLLTTGARTVFIRYKNGKCGLPPTIARLLADKPYKVAIVALANKMARIVWALLTRQEDYDYRGAQIWFAGAKRRA